MSFNPENKTNSLEAQDHSDPSSKIAATEAMIKKLEGMIQMATTTGKLEIAEELAFRKKTNEATLQSLQQEADLGDLDFTTPVEQPKDKPVRNFDVADMSDTTTTRLDARGNI